LPSLYDLPASMEQRCATPLVQTAFGEFLRSFRSKAHQRGVEGHGELVAALGHAAWEQPLPPPWHEETNKDGAVYFWNEARGESTWQHPLMEVFLSALDALLEIIRDAHSVSDVVVGLAAHLKDADAVAAGKLEGWTCHSQDGTEFYFNDLTGQSSWENPAESAQHELHAHYRLAARFLKHFYGDVAQFDAMSEMAGAEVGPLLAALSCLEPPEEVQDYAEWIRVSMASNLPTQHLLPRATRTRPPLPPLTALPLRGDIPTPATGLLGSQGPGTRAPEREATVNIVRSATAMGRLERRKRSRPPLTKYPLRRSLTIWKAVAQEEANTPSGMSHGGACVQVCRIGGS